MTNETKQTAIEEVANEMLTALIHVENHLSSINEFRKLTEAEKHIHHIVIKAIEKSSK